MGMEMYCVQCGGKLGLGHNYCSSCGVATQMRDTPTLKNAVCRNNHVYNMRETTRTLPQNGQLPLRNKHVGETKEKDLSMMPPFFIGIILGSIGYYFLGLHGGAAAAFAGVSWQVIKKIRGK